MNEEQRTPNEEQRTPEEIIVAEARSWLGTRWVHNQAKKGHGVDCARLIIEVYRCAGIIPEGYVPPPYSQQHALHRDDSLLLEEVAKFAVKIWPGRPMAIPKDIGTGDVLIFRYDGQPGHAGICVAPGRMVHALLLRRKVVESPIADFASHLDSIWRPHEDR